MHRPTTLIAVLALLFAPVVPAEAQVAQPIQTVELSPDMVTRFIASIPTLSAVIDKYEGQIPKRQEATGNSPMSALQGYAAYRQIKAEMDGAVGGFGFSSYEDWVAVVQTTMLTFAYLKTTAAQAATGPMIQNALRALEANKSLSAVQRAQIRKSMTQSMTMASGFPAPSENNLGVVRTMGSQIETALNTLSSRK
ncbi:MAG: hypothetical protein ACTSY1_02570 [Alphaproteobacteria bacterium]